MANRRAVPAAQSPIKVHVTSTIAEMTGSPCKLATGRATNAAAMKTKWIRRRLKLIGKTAATRLMASTDSIKNPLSLRIEKMGDATTVKTRVKNSTV